MRRDDRAAPPRAPGRRRPSASRTAVVDTRSPSTIDASASPSTLKLARARAQGAKSPARRAPKRKSSPTSTQRTPRRAHQHVVDEVFRRQLREPRIEARDIGARHAQRAKELELLPQRVSRAGAPVAREELARMRLERQHRRRQAQVVRGFAAAAPAWPGGRDARRRSCRSSVPSGMARGGKSAMNPHVVRPRVGVGVPMQAAKGN